jgi:hypothetical protein
MIRHADDKVAGLPGALSQTRLIARSTRHNISGNILQSGRLPRIISPLSGIRAGSTSQCQLKNLITGA